MSNSYLRTKTLLLIVSILLAIHVKGQNVGVGTATPVSKLNVEGNGAATEILRISNDKNATKDSIIVMTSGGIFGIGTTTPVNKLAVVAGADDWAASFFGQATSNTVRIGTYLGVAAIGSNNNALNAWRDLTINPGGGNVGIGTTTPGKILDVNGTARIVDHFIFNSQNGVINWGNAGHLYFRTNTTQGNELTFTDRMILSNQGYLGINTGIPGSPLQIDEPYNLSTPMLNLRQTTGSWGSAANFDSYRYIQTNYTGAASEYKQFNVGAGGVSVGYSAVPSYNSSDALYVNGNVGIGTNSPSRKLHVIANSNDQSVMVIQNQHSAGYSSIDFYNNSSALASFFGYSNSSSILLPGATLVGSLSGPLAFLTGPSMIERMRIDLSGNVGIGTSTNLNAKLNISGPGGIAKALYITGGYTIFDNNSSILVGLGTNAGAMAITGNFTAGEGEADFMNISPAGFEKGFRFYSSRGSGTTSYQLAQITEAGTIYSVNGSYLFSDSRLKKDVVSLGSDISNKLLNLKTYSYTFDKAAMDKYNLAWSGDLHYGVMAQELEKLFPSLVQTGNDGLKHVSYEGLVPLVIKTVQEQNKLILELTRRIEALEKR